MLKIGGSELKNNQHISPEQILIEGMDDMAAMHSERIEHTHEEGDFNF